MCKGIGHRVGDCAQASEQQKKGQACYNCNSPGHKGINQSKEAQKLILSRWLFIG